MPIDTLQDRINRVINVPEFEKSLESSGFCMIDFQAYWAPLSNGDFNQLPEAFQKAILAAEAATDTGKSATVTAIEQDLLAEQGKIIEQLRQELEDARSEAAQHLAALKALQSGAVDTDAGKLAVEICHRLGWNSDVIPELAAELKRFCDRIKELDGPCSMCGSPTESLAGNPGLWPVHLPDKAGSMRNYHTACVIHVIDQLRAQVTSGERALGRLDAQKCEHLTQMSTLVRSQDQF